MMTDANYDGPMYGFTTYMKAPMMLSMLGAIVGDSAVTRAMSNYARTWRFKHPSPWDFMFAMNRELGQDLGWFWYYWLFTTESSDGAIKSVTTRGDKTYVTIRQDGEMPSPVVLRVEFAADGPDLKPMKGAVIEGNVATITEPVDVWFSGSRVYVVELDFGKRKIEKLVLDPQRRFPDRNPSDNSWPDRDPRARRVRRARTERGRDVAGPAFRQRQRRRHPSRGAGGRRGRQRGARPRLRGRPLDRGGAGAVSGGNSASRRIRPWSTAAPGPTSWGSGRCCSPGSRSSAPPPPTSTWTSAAPPSASSAASSSRWPRPTASSGRRPSAPPPPPSRSTTRPTTSSPASSRSARAPSTGRCIARTKSGRSRRWHGSSGLLLHMDGARLANAAAALDLPLRALTADVGVDVLSFGGTKNGAMAAEAVVFFDSARDAAVRFGRKQAMQLPSKMRFMAAQFEALLRDGLWRRNALHANRMARRLAEGAATVPGVTITQPVDANAVFAILPRERIAALQERRAFLVWDQPRAEVRWMCSFDTTRAGRGFLRRGHARSPRLTPGRKARSICFQSSFTHVGARCTSPSPCLAEEECSCAPS